MRKFVILALVWKLKIILYIKIEAYFIIYSNAKMTPVQQLNFRENLSHFTRLMKEKQG